MDWVFWTFFWARILRLFLENVVEKVAKSDRKKIKMASSKIRLPDLRRLKLQASLCAKCTNARHGNETSPLGSFSEQIPPICHKTFPNGYFWRVQKIFGGRLPNPLTNLPKRMFSKALRPVWEQISIIRSETSPNGRFGRVHNLFGGRFSEPAANSLQLAISRRFWT